MPARTRQDDRPTKPTGTDWSRVDAKTDEEAEAAALADSDAPPLADGRRMHRMSRVKRLRWALKLSREEFSARYHIPLDIVAAWERYEAEPDVVAITLLDAIAADPEGLARALAAKPSVPPAAAE